jgi:cell wall-associated NlpC family hydrolase
MRRLLFLASAFVCVLSVGTAPGAASTAHWAQTEIRTVVAAGYLAPSVATFRPDATLTQGEGAQLVAQLTGRPAVAVANPSAPVTMLGLNARLVDALGLRNSAAQFTRAARAAGLQPPARFGNEVVARLLGLRKNHLAAVDALERLPSDPATRAEAAYSISRILRLSTFQLESARTAAGTLAPTTLTSWQRRVLTTAMSFVGFPYVWGGESESRTSPYGPQAQGGFDCSGFVWRVYKLQRYEGAPTLPNVLRGRTTYDMSGEVAPGLRIPFARLAPGDVIFFGAAGPRSRPNQVDHMGIYVAPGWFVHSSRDGVTLAPLSGWFREKFAWARRPLAEAGLAPASSPV